MNKSWLYLSVFVLLGCLFTTSCSESNDAFIPQTSEQIINLSEQQVNISHDGRYYRIVVTADSLNPIRISTDADWIALDADTLSASGSFNFYVMPNNSDRSRDGYVKFRMGDDVLTKQVSIHQTCEAEDGENALSDSITRKTRVGYGYNMLIDYMDPKSVTEPIFDYNKLLKAEQEWGAVISQEGRSLEDFKLHCAYNIEDMASWLSEQTTTETKILFFNKKVQKFNQISEASQKQRTYGYSSLEKIVATRFLDAGKIESLVRQGYDVFTDDFRAIMQEINSAPNAENISKLLTKYGTHFVIYADLGGRLDYMVNFRSKETSRESVERYLKYKNGKLKKSEESDEASHNILSVGGLTFDIYGGTQDAIRKLESSAATRDCYGQISSACLGEWLNSINANKSSSLAMISCQLKPIWQLFSNQEARVQIISQILKLVNSEGGDISARLQYEGSGNFNIIELGLDNFYKIQVTDDMLKFGGSNSSTLVKVGYYDNIPKVEICNEYVPEIRGDQRVNIFYPIYKNQTNIRRGIFIGDNSNPPSEVMFDNEGGCYVRPLEGYKLGDKLSTLYYIDGAFYTTNMGINIPNIQLNYQPHYINLEAGSKYAVVKIGSGYWTRQNLKDDMEFGEPVDPDDPNCYDYDIYETVTNNMLYANIFYGNSLSFRESHPGVFDADEDSFGNRIHWYVPREKDILALEKYIGMNHKSLFKEQQSGFDAQFAGYIGGHDVFSGKKIKDDLHYNGSYCFIASKEVLKNSGQALILAPNYTLLRKEIRKTDDNLFPVRAYRSSYYKYK